MVEIDTSRLDQCIRDNWEKTLEDEEVLPSYKDLSTFLKNRARILDAASGNSAFTTNKCSSCSSFLSQKVYNKNNKHVLAYHTTPNAPVDKAIRPPGCTFCKGLSCLLPHLFQDGCEPKENLHRRIEDLQKLPAY